MSQASSLSSKTHRISPLALLPFAYHFTQASAPTFKSETHLGAEPKTYSTPRLQSLQFGKQPNFLFCLHCTNIYFASNVCSSIMENHILLLFFAACPVEFASCFSKHVSQVFLINKSTTERYFLCLFDLRRRIQQLLALQSPELLSVQEKQTSKKTKETQIVKEQLNILGNAFVCFLAESKIRRYHSHI